nr:type VI secretion system ATPase TssH [Acidobacteriota bacterium]
MSISLDKFTEKAQEALQDAQKEALRRHHQQLDDLHLLAALLRQEGGLAAPLLQKAGATPAMLERQAEEALSRIPAVTGDGAGSVALGAGPRLQRVLLDAEEQAKGLKDEYVSVEHL